MLGMSPPISNLTLHPLRFVIHITDVLFHSIVITYNNKIYCFQNRFPYRLTKGVNKLSSPFWQLDELDN